MRRERETGERSRVGRACVVQRGRHATCVLCVLCVPRPEPALMFTAHLVCRRHGAAGGPGAGRDGAGGGVEGSVEDGHTARGHQHGRLALAVGINGQHTEDCGR